MTAAVLRLEAGLNRTPSKDRELARGDSERTDVALAAAGDERAFERLYRAHVNRIHSLVRRLAGGEADVDELVQDVFVRGWQRLATFRGEAAFGTWLHRLAVNQVLNTLKGGARARRLFTADEDAAGLAAGPRATPDVAMDLEDALALLPPGARQIFVLHDVEGFRHEEIAQLLGVAVGTSKAQLHRARMLLRRHLER